jgi:hypothetical protein
LGGINHQKAMLLCQRVHSRTGGKVVGRLGTAVQHDDQGQRFGPTCIVALTSLRRRLWRYSKVSLAAAKFEGHSLIDG